MGNRSARLIHPSHLREAPALDRRTLNLQRRLQRRTAVSPPLPLMHPLPQNRLLSVGAAALPADTVRITYPPNLKRKPEYISQDEYLSRHEAKVKKARVLAEEPWHPFKTRSDFDFAELVFKAHLSRDQISALLGVVQRCIGGNDRLTFGDFHDVQASWNEAQHLVEPVCCQYCYVFCRPAVV